MPNCSSSLSLSFLPAGFLSCTSTSSISTSLTIDASSSTEGSADDVTSPTEPNDALGAVDQDADGMRGLEALLDSPTRAAPSPWDDDLDAVEACGFESLDASVGPTPLFWANLPFFGPCSGASSPSTSFALLPILFHLGGFVPLSST